MDLCTSSDIAALSQRRGFRQAAAKALDLAYELMLSPNGKRQVHHDLLYRLAGRPNSNFGAYFHTFFSRTGQYIPGERSFDYSVKDWKLPLLEKHAGCNHNTHAFAAKCQSKGRTFTIQPPARADLPRTGHRLYPWWAMMKREWREKLFLEEHGEMWDYDISNAKPTLLLQVYDKLRGHREGKLSTWRWYVEDKEAVRRQLMDDLGWDKRRTKAALQAVCNGAWVGRIDGCLEDEWDLQDHPIYIGLRADFKQMWNVLSALKRDGETQGQTLSREYAALEDTVMTAISETIDPPEWVWWIHDGWMTKNPVFLDTQYVYQKTGLKIEIEEAKQTTHTQPPTHTL